MRKTLQWALPLVLLLFGSVLSQAQITAITINTSTSKLDSFTRSCTPANMRMIVNATLSGPYTTDSVIVFVDFGDGVVLNYVSNTYGSGFGVNLIHTYSTAGTYTAKVRFLSRLSPTIGDSISKTFTLGACPTKTKLTCHWDDSASRCAIPHPYYMYGYGTYSGPLAVADSAHIKISFGDGTDTTIHKVLSRFGTDSGSYSFSLFHNYNITGTFTPRVTVNVTPSGTKDTMWMPVFTVSDSCATVKGKLYLDDNLNCTIDAGEKGIYAIPIEYKNTATGVSYITPGWSDASGNYSVSLPAGSYEITPLINRISTAFSGLYGYISRAKNLNATCPSTGTTSITVAPLSSYTQDFAYECKPTDTQDAFTYASASCFVAGDTALMDVFAGASFWTMYHGLCLNLPATLTLTLDSKLSYLGTYSGPTPSVSGSTLTWSLTGTDLSGFLSRLKLRVSTSTTIGDTLTSVVELTPSSTWFDPNLANNKIWYKRVVRSSYDPNEKEVTPKGDGEPGYVAANTPLIYTIHFQNTGNAPARNITIKDTLLANLDEASVNMIHSTHNVKLYQNGKELTFRFADINLPDSGANYYGSMGSVTYSLMPKLDLPPGTQMRNRAGIYFDYNAPIITNYALNTVRIPTRIQDATLGTTTVSIFPNPANNELNMQASGIEYQVRISDMLGRVVFKGSSQNGALKVNTAAFGGGIYLLHLTDTAQNSSSTKIMIAH